MTRMVAKRQVKRLGPTLRDVAAHAGVSTATVSFVLNNTQPVAPETRARVELALAALDYRMSRSARALRTGRHHAIGLVVPDLANPFFPALAQAVTDSAWARGHALILATSRLAHGIADPAAEAEALASLSERADGIIWIPATAAPGFLPRCPAVILDRPSPSLKAFDSISADHYAGGTAMASLVRASRRQHVGLLAGPAGSPSAQSRRAGFLDNRAGFEIIWQEEVSFTLILPDHAAARLNDPRLDFVVAASDVVAIGALRVLRGLGRSVPEEVSVAGFDDIPWAALAEPPLTTIRQPVAELGEGAVAMLLERIADPRQAPRHLFLPITVVERATTRRLQARAA
jgi:LacI family transcriptional regulator